MSYVKPNTKDKTVVVESGDTLWSIVGDHTGSVNQAKIKAVAALNKIVNPDLIYVGQEIKLEGSSSTTSGSSTSSSSVITITAFGLQANTERTLFATWSWNKDKTDKYQIKWEYYAKAWFVGNSSSISVDEHDPDASKQSTYSIPDNATQVRFKVKPVAKKTTKNGVDSYPWTAGWSTVKTYDVNKLPPPVPDVPTVELDGAKLTATIDNIDVGITRISFQIVKDNSTIFKTVEANITTAHAACSVNVTLGAEYKVRARAYSQGGYGEWSDYSSSVSTIPARPVNITQYQATSDTSIYLGWDTIPTADSYDIEYTDDITNFDTNADTTTVTDIEYNWYELTGLESGKKYSVRVRAVNTEGHSAWSLKRTVTVGKAPSAPTTWSSTTKVITGETLNLYWVHNSEDGSSQTYAELELTINGRKSTVTVPNSTDEDEKDKTSVWKINTSSYVEGVKIEWRVRTRGVLDEYGEWSTLRTVDVYSPPVLELSVINSRGSIFDTLESFPIRIKGTTYPYSQTPVGYRLSIVSNETYETVDYLGNETMVNQGDEVYSRYVDTSSQLSLSISAGDVNLDNNISYTLTCSVTMSSGLTATDSATFVVAWADMVCQPNAEISLDSETLVTYIRPYCEDYILTYRRVEYSNFQYVVTEETLDGVYGSPIRGAATTTGEMVYSGVNTTGEAIFYCQVREEKVLDNISLAVYRREFDGSFTELGTDIANLSNTTIVDPHPALDYARYRVVAMDDSTGAINFCDLPGFPVGEKAAIIQWEEDWSTFDVSNEDAMEQPAWAGSMIKLPYNIDVSDSHDTDVSLIKYIGRKHPVSYYGTQVGTSSTWNVEIPKSDKDTLYALRRLAVWMGDVYVREPSGSGYWANISVSFSQRHCEVTIPVTLSITRVAGGA